MGRASLLLAGLIALSCMPGGLADYFTTQNCATGSPKAPRIERVGQFRNKNDYYGGSGVEVLAYSNYFKKAAILAVVESNSNSSGVRLLDVTDITAPKEIKFLASPYGFPNSVSFHDNVLAVACDGGPNSKKIGAKTDTGYVLLYTLSVSGAGLDAVLTKKLQLKTKSGMICAMPDMLTWNDKGDKIYTACEGEPSTQDTEGSDPNVGANPAGAIGVVSVKLDSNGIPDGQTAAVSKIISIQAYLDSLNKAQYVSLIARGLLIDSRIIGDKARAANDIEPEYIALSDDGATLYCTLQENNAILVVDLATETIRDIWPLGFKNWNKFSIDVSDKDGPSGGPLINMQKYANLKGLYQPDTIVYRRIGGKGYLFIANEGDGKEDKTRVKDLPTNLLPTAGALNWTDLQKDGKMGRLNVNPSCGLKNPFDKSQGYKFLCTYGGRSFSILDADTGKTVYESGNDFEMIIKAQMPTCFNCDRDANTADVRSDDSGPEPEALEVMELNGRFFALIGLERQSGFMVYDVTNPKKPSFVQWWVYRDYTLGLEFEEEPPFTNASKMGDMAPEMIKFIPSHKSHTKKPLLLITNEYSASVTLHTVLPCGEPLKPTV